MAKDTFYFSHDYNARLDEKIKLLIRKHKMEGYGVWWSIVEDLYNNANALRTDYEGIAYELRVDESMVKSIINNFDLFVIDGDFFGSKSIQKRLEVRNEKTKKARQSAVRRWEKQKEEMPTQCERIETQYEGNAIKETKGKETKETTTIVVSDEVYPFDEFWMDYDKKTGDKEKLKKKWEKITISNREKIREHLKLYKLSQPDKQYRKNPETYLNNQSWNDEIIFKNEKRTEKTRGVDSDQSFIASIAAGLERGTRERNGT